jgi:exosortase A
MISKLQDDKRLLISFVGLFFAWLLVVYESIWSAIEIWIGNEIYNHCLIVIPASIYLIYEKRHVIDWSKQSMSWLAALLFCGQLLFFILSTAADIQLFQHVATFSMLSTLFWIFVGNKIAWDLKFPLFFVLFAVPVGEELVPFLQEITADMSVYMLNLTGIPLYRSGLFIEIPQGKFLVAEACSGVSFLIASVVLGNLYAYMNLRSLRRRVFFLILSFAFPIFANAIRVYGIIYIGYSSDMQHAVGADHLIYGWFFFAFVLVCLFLIGELIRRNEVKKLASIEFNNQESDEIETKSSLEPWSISGKVKVNTALCLVVLVLVVLTKIQVTRMDSPTVLVQSDLTLNLTGFEASEFKQGLNWKPRYVGNTKEKMSYVTRGQNEYSVYFAYFDGSKGELASSLHRLYEQDRWTRERRSQSSLGEASVNVELATSSIGVKKEIIYWYLVDGKIMNNYKDVKIHQLMKKLQGESSQSAVIAVSIDIERNMPSKQQTLEEAANIILKNNLNLLAGE